MEDRLSAGTVRVSDINPGEAGSNPRGHSIGDTLFFSATDGSSGDELGS